MKKISIEFIEDQRWKFVWSIASISCCIFLIFMSWYSYQIYQKKNELTQLTQNTSLLMPGKPSVSIRTQDSRYASSLKAASLLQFDLNKVFSTIENMSEPSIRLINVTFDASSGSLRLEYELDSVEGAVVLTEKLNGGYEVRPWQLESVSTTKSTGPNGIATSASKTIGVWRCNIKNI